jgi:hypothetical protein
MALTDPNLQNAAIALLDTLQSSGCPQGFDSDVQTFQQAYVNAGGVLPNDSGGRSGIDGLYGNNTSGALQATINANSGNAALAGFTAPPGCVAAASGGTAPSGGGGSSSNSSTSTTTSTASFVSAIPGGWWTVAAVTAVGAALVYESVGHHGVAGMHRATRGMHGHARKLLKRRGRPRRRR